MPPLNDFSNAPIPAGPDSMPTTVNMGGIPVGSVFRVDPEAPSMGEGYYGAPDGFAQQVKNAFSANHADIDDTTAQYFADQLWMADPTFALRYQANPDRYANSGFLGAFLFSPKSTMPQLAYQAMQQLDPDNLTTSQAEFVNAGGKPTATTASILQQAGALGTGNNEIMSIIADEAQKAGKAAGLNPDQIKELVAVGIATADAESGLNPNAVGDQGHSVGLFQLHDQGMGYGMGNSRYDPRTNAAKALASMAAVFAANPGLSPGEIAAMSQRPADPSGYAGIVNGIFGKIMGGQLPSISQPGKTFGPGYQQAEAIYRQYFGATADPSVIEGIMASGNDKQQMEDYVRSLPSHISGMTIGQYSDQRKLGDSVAQQILGHQITDNMVAEMWNQNISTPTQIERYLNFLRGPVVGQQLPPTQAAAYADQAPVGPSYNPPAAVVAASDQNDQSSSQPSDSSAGGPGDFNP